MKRKILSALMICFVSVMISCGLFFVGDNLNIKEDESVEISSSIPSSVDGLWVNNIAESFENIEVISNKLYIDIASASQLARLSSMIIGDKSYSSNSKSYNYSEATVYLWVDIDLSAHYWVPIGSHLYPFKGEFFGNGYTISNMYIDSNWYIDSYCEETVSEDTYCVDKNGSICEGCDTNYWMHPAYGHKIHNYKDTYAKYYAGLFGHTAGANLEDFEVTGQIFIDDVNYYNQFVLPNRYLGSDLYVGSVVGLENDVSGSISGIDSHVDIEINLLSAVNYMTSCGGLYGKGYYVSNCFNHGDIYYSNSNVGTAYIGGIAGHINGERAYAPDLGIEDCGNYGRITCDSTACAGGISGLVVGNIGRCANLGDIYYQTGIDWSTGKTTKTFTPDELGWVGGIVGWFEGKTDGAIFEVADCVNYGYIMGPLSGEVQYVKNRLHYFVSSYTEDFDVLKSAGGIVGFLNNQGVVNRSVNYGTINSKILEMGGIVGFMQAEIVFLRNVMTSPANGFLVAKGEINDCVQLGEILGGETVAAYYRRPYLVYKYNGDQVKYAHNFGQIVSNMCTKNGGGFCVSNCHSLDTLNGNGADIFGSMEDLTKSTNGWTADDVLVDQYNGYGFYNNADNWVEEFSVGTLTGSGETWVVTPLVWEYFKRLDPSYDFSAFGTSYDGRGKYSMLPTSMINVLEIGDVYYLDDNGKKQAVPYSDEDIDPISIADSIYLNYFTHEKMYKRNNYNWHIIEKSSVSNFYTLHGIDYEYSNDLFDFSLGVQGKFYFEIEKIYLVNETKQTTLDLVHDGSGNDIQIKEAEKYEQLQVELSRIEYDASDFNIEYLDAEGNTLTNRTSKVSARMLDGKHMYDNFYEQNEYETDAGTVSSRNLMLYASPKIGYKIFGISTLKDTRVWDPEYTYTPQHAIHNDYATYGHVVKNEDSDTEDEVDDSLGDKYIEISRLDLYWLITAQKVYERKAKPTFYVWVDYVEYTYTVYDQLHDVGAGNPGQSGVINSAELISDGLSFVYTGEFRYYFYTTLNGSLFLNSISEFQYTDESGGHHTVYDVFGSFSGINWDEAKVVDNENVSTAETAEMADVGIWEMHAAWGSIKDTLGDNKQNKFNIAIHWRTGNLAGNFVATANSYFDRDKYSEYSDGYGGSIVGENTSQRLGDFDLKSPYAIEFLFKTNENFYGPECYKEDGVTAFKDVYIDYDLSELSDDVKNVLDLEGLEEKIQKLNIFNLNHDRYIGDAWGPYNFIEDHSSYFTIGTTSFYVRLIWNVYHNSEMYIENGGVVSDDKKDSLLTQAEAEAILSLRSFDVVAKFTLKEFFIAGDVMLENRESINVGGNVYNDRDPYLLSAEEDNQLINVLEDAVKIRVPAYSSGAIEQDLNLYTGRNNDCYNANKVYYQTPYVLMAKDYEDSTEEGYEALYGEEYGYKFLGWYLRATRKVDDETRIIYQPLSYKKTFIFENGSFINGVEEAGVCESRGVYYKNELIENADTIVIVAVYDTFYAEQEAPESETLNGQTIYKISSRYNLNWMARQSFEGVSFEGDVFIQMKNITCGGGTTIRTASSNWLPIGSVNTPFKGTYNGNGYVIYNLIMAHTIAFPLVIDAEYEGYSADYNDVEAYLGDKSPIPTAYTGFFGFTNGATIKNLKIHNATFCGYENSGAVVGCAIDTTFENVGVNVLQAEYKLGVISCGTVANEKIDLDSAVFGEDTKMPTLKSAYLYLDYVSDPNKESLEFYWKSKYAWTDRYNEYFGDLAPYRYAYYYSATKSYVATSYNVRSFMSDGRIHEKYYWFTVGEIVGFAKNCNFYMAYRSGGLVEYGATNFYVDRFVGLVDNATSFELCYTSKVYTLSGIDHNFVLDASQVINCYAVRNYYGADPASDPDVWMKLNGKWVLKCYYWC